METARPPAYRLTMCGGVTYIEGGAERHCDFTSPRASLPVITRRSGVVMVAWGRRRNEGGELPLGGWAWLESIRSGSWNGWQPKPVRLQLEGFMEQDIQGNNHWFKLTSGQWVQGLVAHHDGEQRVYVVTIHPQMPEAIHTRWPRIVSA
jgi:hypothetical protein